MRRVLLKYYRILQYCINGYVGHARDLVRGSIIANAFTLFLIKLLTKLLDLTFMANLYGYDVQWSQSRIVVERGRGDAKFLSDLS